MKNSTLMFLIVLAAVTLSFAQNRALFPIEQNGKTGYINDKGKIVINPVFDDGWPFSEGLAPVKMGDEWGYIDETGKIKIKPRFFGASRFSEGIASVGVYFEGRRVVNSEIGYSAYIDKSGNLISDRHFGVAFAFSEGLAKVSTSDYRNA